MTALTVPARPEEGARLRPLPWRRMAWVTWRQHRFALAGVAVLLGALAVYLWLTGLQIHHTYAAGCHPASSLACAENFTGRYGVTAIFVSVLLQAVPALIGAFTGAPVLARELETGTFRYAWTQGIGRWRWTLGKLVLLAVAVAAAAGAFSVMFSWYNGRSSRAGLDAVLDPRVQFDLHGVAFGAWTLGSRSASPGGRRSIQAAPWRTSATMGCRCAVTCWYRRVSPPLGALTTAARRDSVSRAASTMVGLTSEVRRGSARRASVRRGGDRVLCFTTATGALDARRTGYASHIRRVGAEPITRLPSRCTSSMRASPLSARRAFDTRNCSALAGWCGGSPGFQSASMSVVIATALPGDSASRASRARSPRPASGCGVASTRTSKGPSNRNSIALNSSRARHVPYLPSRSAGQLVARKAAATPAQPACPVMRRGRRAAAPGANAARSSAC